LPEEQGKSVNLHPGGNVPLSNGLRDRLLFNIFCNLSSTLGLHAYSIRPSTSETSVDFYPVGGESRAVLKVSITKKGTGAFRLRGYASREEIDIWKIALRSALDRMSEDPAPEFEWSALIGPAPETNLSLNCHKLRDASGIGNVKLAPSPFRLFELVSQPAPQSGARLTITWPIRVSGTTYARDSSEARGAVAYELRLICGLISLILGECWTIRSGPHLCSPDQLLFPKTSPDLVQHEQNAQDYPESTTFALPEWSEYGLTVLHRDRLLADALIALHESMLLTERHTSMAVVAVVAAVESIGSKYEKLKVCDCCKDCKYEVGYSQRFSKALRRVLHELEAKQLDEAYDTRSRTAHTGRLLDDDQRFGIRSVMAVLDANKARELSNLIYTLQTACRRLLVLELGGPQTWQLTAPPERIGKIIAASVLVSGTDKN
jgi:hypothetical protein